MTVRRPGFLVLAVDVDAPVEATWAAATDWQGQGRWMLATDVRPVTQRGRGLGARVEAATGVGVLRVVDTMRVTRWEPPRACDVVHTGRLVRGTGSFQVEARAGDRSRFVWREDLELPLGRLGRAGWPVVRPLVAAGVRLSLRRFARWVERGSP